MITLHLTLYQWLPHDLEWDLYMAICHVCEQVTVPRHLLNARLAMIYKAGPP